jgi:hypothetical protein
MVAGVGLSQLTKMEASPSKMEDSLTHITWMSAASARLRHSPPLLLYVSEPAQCNTATIVERRLIRKTIKQWLIDNGTPSPMLRDTIRRRIGLRQYEEKRQIYRHKTFGELWSDFKAEEKIRMSFNS